MWAHLANSIVLSNVFQCSDLQQHSRVSTYPTNTAAWLCVQHNGQVMRGSDIADGNNTAISERIGQG